MFEGPTNRNGGTVIGRIKKSTAIVMDDHLSTLKYV